MKQRSGGNSSARLCSTSDWCPSRTVSTSLMETGAEGREACLWGIRTTGQGTLPIDIHLSKHPRIHPSKHASIELLLHLCLCLPAPLLAHESFHVYQLQILLSPCDPLVLLGAGCFMESFMRGAHAHTQSLS